MKHLICPISSKKVNENVIRINALLGVVILLAGFASESFVFFLFLMADFYIRAFTSARYSPISYIGGRMANALNLEKKSIDKAPKIFAARIGFLMTLIITFLYVLNFQMAAFILGGVLIFFATLEFALALCMGCLLYTYLILPFYK